MLAGEVRRELRAALEPLPDRQRIVLTLRDVLGHTSEEVCDAARDLRRPTSGYCSTAPAPPSALGRIAAYRGGELTWPRLSCQQLVELVTDYLEGTLGWRDRRRFEQAPRGLRRRATRYLEQMRETLALLGTVPVDTLSPEAQSTLLDAFRDLRR